MGFLIIGNSGAGLAAAEAIRQYDRLSPVTILSDERTWAYSRVVLSWLVKDEISERALFFRGPEFYEQLDVTLIRGERIVQVSPADHVVYAASGRAYSYSRLLVATGSSANRLRVPGAALEGVHVLRSLTDARAIRAEVDQASSVLIAGGGLVGVKCADALAHHGLRVLLVVSSGQILSQVLNPEASRIAEERLSKLGVEIRCHTSVERFAGDKRRLRTAYLSDGTCVPCDLAIVGKGVTPNLDLVKDSRIAVNRGILVNERQQTNVPDIFAAGDVAEAFDAVTGDRDICANWPVAVAQGHVAGANMAEGDLKYRGNLRANVFEIGGVSFGSMGHVRALPGVDVCSCGPDQRGWGTWLYTRRQRLVGATLIGNVSGLPLFKWLIRNQTLLPSDGRELLKQPQSYLAYLAKQYPFLESALC